MFPDGHLGLANELCELQWFFLTLTRQRIKIIREYLCPVVPREAGSRKSEDLSRAQ
jgi:hypothetical protein